MSDLIVMSSQVGNVLVDDELVEFLGAGAIDAAIGHLRLGGGWCLACGATIHHVEDVSLIVHATSVGAKVAFVHMRCGPPQLLDARRNRRAAIAMDTYFKDRCGDAQAFVAYRSDPAPRGMLVVTQQATVKSWVDNGELVSPWLDLCLTAGLVPIAPDVLDAVPELVDGWALRVDGHGDLVCSTPLGDLYDVRPE